MYERTWRRLSPEERCLSGVGFIVRDYIATKLTNLPIGHSDRIISMCLPRSVQQHATFFSVYAPTLLADPDEKCFFTQSSLLRHVPANDKIVIHGDFNAKVWAETWTPGRVYLENMALVNEITMVAYYLNYALNNNCVSPTLSSNRTTV